MARRTITTTVPRPHLVGLLLGLGLILFFVVKPRIFKTLSTPPVIETLRSAKDIQLALGSFAMDHNGEYPNARTAAIYGLPEPGHSNGFFRQLFASESASSERIFWIRGSQLCSPSVPDDRTSDSFGGFSPGATLKPGDNGWAYVLGQANETGPNRVLMVNSPPTASGLIFDRDLWEGKAIVVRIDGSARPERLTSDGRLLDGDGVELLTPASAVWDGTPVEIAYPEPAPK